ncbi:N-formylglutamate deformylase [Fontimonas sp. SYSU GA230001]|uniref:N-formylglutamate deformylase n=1 Tax=Fontimonas sp. SYSU GA230001 TaxID=3142450 RepID=UPI0032B4E37A
MSAQVPLLDVWCEGRTPLLIDVPHAGTYIPDELRAALTPHAQNVPDADWHVPQLYAFATERGASLMVATHARYVIDLNRDPQGAVLYPGADNSELVPTTGFDRRPLYRPGTAPTAAEIEARRARYWAPYHAQLAQRLEAIRARHGYAILLDAHSIRSRVPRFFAGRLPDLNLGTADGGSCAASLQAAAFDVLGRADGFSAVCNGRFKGGYITRHHGAPARGVHALQLEIAQACYMHEDPPWPWEPQRARPLRAVLERLIGALLAWRP